MLVIRKEDWSIFRNHYLFLKTGISHLTYFLTQLITIRIMTSLIINSKHRQRNRWSNNENISDCTISYHYNGVNNSLQLIWHLICYCSVTVLIIVWRISTDNVELDTEHKEGVFLHFIKISPLSSPVNMPLLQEKVQWKHLFMFTVSYVIYCFTHFSDGLWVQLLQENHVYWCDLRKLIIPELSSLSCLSCLFPVTGVETQYVFIIYNLHFISSVFLL